MNNALMNAILSMDAYNHGYDESVTLATVLNSTQIGNATIIAQSDITGGSDAREAGFYALAYDYNGETIIAYRGTDYPQVDTYRDHINGWPLGHG